MREILNQIWPNFLQFGQRKLEERVKSWMDNKPIIYLESEHGNSYGKIKYGIRLPIRPATTPLHDCDPGSKERIEGQIPYYWFVSQGHNGCKVLFTRIYSVNDEQIKARGYDAGENFDMTLRYREF